MNELIVINQNDNISLIKNGCGLNELVKKT